MIDKTFKTYDEQLKILESRGIVFNSWRKKAKAKQTLQREGYYKLINGYKDLFLKPDNSEEYLENTTIGEIYALYRFDRELREIFLRHILRVETNIKNLISYRISEMYGHDNYLKYSNFNTSMKGANQHISSVIADTHKQISNNTSDPCIKHYLQNYGYVPMWVLSNILTLGAISKFYSIMKTDDRQYVSKIFKISDKTLESFLYFLSKVRNFSAHGNRLYCLRNKTPLSNTNIHSNLSIALVNEEYTCGKRDLFAAVIALRYLLSVNEFSVLLSELDFAINKLASSLKVINIDKVLNVMGFPSNWKDIMQKGIK